jgi:CDP-diacylglycerol--glycerol-3-phosphate 3-phosphatidyltransferase
VRARAQSLGFTCDVGILARPERVVIICAGLILESVPILAPFQPLTIALTILAVGTNFTAVQRVWVVWQQNRAELRAARGAPVPTTTPNGSAQPVRAAMRRFFESLSKT